MPGTGIAHLRKIPADDCDDRGDGRLQREAQISVNSGEDLRRLRRPKSGGEDTPPQALAGDGRIESVTGNVADGKYDTSVRKLEGVIPVAADQGLALGRDVQRIRS